MSTYEYPVKVTSAQIGDETTFVGLATVHGAGSDAISATTKYLGGPGATVAAAQVPLYLCKRAGTIRNLFADLLTAPASSATWVATVQKSSDHGSTWSDTTLTCTITGTAKNNSDVAHSPTVAAGDLLAIKAVSSGSTAAGANVSFEVT